MRLEFAAIVVIVASSFVLVLIRNCHLIWMNYRHGRTLINELRFDTTHNIVIAVWLLLLLRLLLLLLCLYLRLLLLLLLDKVSRYTTTQRLLKVQLVIRLIVTRIHCHLVARVLQLVLLTHHCALVKYWMALPEVVMVRGISHWTLETK